MKKTRIFNNGDLAVLLITAVFLTSGSQSWASKTTQTLASGWESNSPDEYNDGYDEPIYVAKKQSQLKIRDSGENKLGTLTRRVASPNLWGYALGPYRSHYLGSEAMLYALSMTNHREVSEYAEVRFRLGGSVSEKGDAYMASFSLGSAYLPLSEDISPLVGAELGLGYAGGKNAEKKAAGFTGTLLAGIRLFRTSDTHLEILGRYEAFTSKNSSGFPATYGLQLGILLR